MSPRTILAAAAAALALGLAGACGGGGVEKEAAAVALTGDAAPGQALRPSQIGTGGGSGTGTGGNASASGGERVLSQAELDRAILAADDVPGFTVDPADGPPPGAETADRAECAPLIALINGRPEPLAQATAYRRIADAADSLTTISEFLTAHGPQAASILLGRLRDAVEACADGFTATGGGSSSHYTAVKRLHAVEDGDEAVAYQVTGDREGLPFPLIFHVVRVGGTVATFHAADPDGVGAPQLPDALLSAQAAKLK
ncbi:hypothetical protein [Streptomyces sp. NPDC051569]|uniref:hypothetical protein n=1 Tax=Streptomyces sp. NPDC051569 TaxID=3365661 RepID=UPI003794152B